MNSIMLTTADVSASDSIGDEQEASFSATDKISPSLYRGNAAKTFNTD